MIPHAPSEKNIGLSIKQELLICGCILLKGYNNDPLQLGALESCIKANVCLFKWLVNDKVEKTELKSTKRLLCVDKPGPAVTYHYIGSKDTKQFGEKNQKIAKDENDNS